VIHRHSLVPKFPALRRSAALLSCLVLAYFVQTATAAYGHVPPYFVENRGQFGSHDVLYVVKGPGITGSFSANKLALTMGQSAFQISFLGSNPAATVEGIQPLAARINYLIGESPAWRTNLPAYSGVAYRGIFPGIDLIYSTSAGHLKSDFIIAPGADPASIRLRYEGGAHTRLDRQGALVVAGANGQLRENAPAVYQDIAGKRVTVRGSFQIRPDGTIGFRVGRYQRTAPLIIDPVLTYSTYFGGSGMDSATGIAIDGYGNTYIAGWTTSTDLSTLNPVRSYNSGGVDAFVAKLGPGGNTLIYCTYLGGRGDDRAFAIAADSAGNAYVTGWTSSSAFPTAAPLQSYLAGGRDAFVAKLNPAGNTLLYSTYLGGGANDSGNGIAVDASGNAYVAGYTYSLNFPTLSAYQSSLRGMENAFVAKLNSSGKLVYSTYLGGNGSDNATSIAIDGAGDAFITGGTTSTNFPTAAALQAASGGNQDAFVTKLNPSGNGLVYSTYLGGSGGVVGSPELGTGIAVDASGAAYVTGATGSTNFPVTAGVPQSAYLGGGSDAFVAKLNPAGSALVYSTYLGGSSVDYASAIAVDFTGSAYVAGYTASYDFLNLRAVQPGNVGPYDAFVTKINPTGSAVVWSTYLGGSNSDAANAIAVDALGSAYVAGFTQSTNFPLQTPYTNFNGGGYGGFVSKISSGWYAGVFLNGSWYLDRNRNGGFDGTAAGDLSYGFGVAGDIPVVGDWTGSGTMKIGVFRGGQWLLDCNGNGVWDGPAGGDCLYTFGQAGDKPVVGDWNGTGKTKIGVFRSGYWMLDTNGSGTWDGTAGGDSGFWFGNSSYTPVVGDWTGAGITRPGLFLNGAWYFDTNSDGICEQSAYFGQAGDVPVVGDWSGSGKSNIGVFRSGFWILDMNGNNALDGLGIGEAGFWLGNSSFTPVVLR
jgi:hypothetical protein